QNVATVAHTGRHVLFHVVETDSAAHRGIVGTGGNVARQRVGAATLEGIDVEVVGPEGLAGHVDAGVDAAPRHHGRHRAGHRILLAAGTAHRSRQYVSVIAGIDVQVAGEIHLGVGQARGVVAPG